MTYAQAAAASAVAMLLCCAAPAAMATVISDAAGDFIAEYVGPQRPDLDVIEIEVTLDGTDFVLRGKMAGAINPASGAIYVWGVNRGAGTARFGANYSGVLFDSVIAVQAAGTGAVNLLNGSPATALPGGAISILGDTLTIRLAASLLPTSGFGLSTYGFNLWPRAAGTGGITQLSDFAPNNATISTPEPGSLALAGFGFLSMAILRRRKQP
jgi:PEP-CTERM motif